MPGLQSRTFLLSMESDILPHRHYVLQQYIQCLCGWMLPFSERSVLSRLHVLPFGHAMHPDIWKWGE